MTPAAASDNCPQDTGRYTHRRQTERVGRSHLICRSPATARRDRSTCTRTLFRQGQLNLSRSERHNDRARHRLDGSIIPQEDLNGSPGYRLDT